MTDVEADGVGSGYGFAWIRLDFGSYSDVRAKARLILIIMVWHRNISITESVRFWDRCDGEREMVDQEYREAWVTSVVKTLKLMVSVQSH
ncbi:5-Hydroxytryptamine Receptor 1B [Manis pentadactyla]|nr:5-Hydroxytryptamine Receptor 1B [Manis pentadactyla]